jgi:hypothetical protein
MKEPLNMDDNTEESMGNSTDSHKASSQEAIRVLLALPLLGGINFGKLAGNIIALAGGLLTFVPGRPPDEEPGDGEEEWDCAHAVRESGEVALSYAVDEECPAGTLRLALGAGPCPDMNIILIANLMICEMEEGMPSDSSRCFRPNPTWGPDGGVRFGYADGTNLYPGDAEGISLDGDLVLELSSSAGCWLVRGENALRTP